MHKIPDPHLINRRFHLTPLFRPGKDEQPETKVQEKEEQDESEVISEE